MILKPSKNYWLIFKKDTLAQISPFTNMSKDTLNYFFIYPYAKKDSIYGIELYFNESIDFNLKHAKFFKNYLIKKYGKPLRSWFYYDEAYKNNMCVWDAGCCLIYYDFANVWMGDHPGKNGTIRPMTIFLEKSLLLQNLERTVQTFKTKIKKK